MMLLIALALLFGLMFLNSKRAPHWTPTGYETGRVEEFIFTPNRRPRSDYKAIVTLDNGERVTVNLTNAARINVGDRVRLAIYKRNNRNHYRYELVY